jgi:Magnesium chelatase, subunit ChlI C-terminal/Magnesium chelatase, subunit ChlI
MPGESKNSPREIQNYLGRISGPLLDRIDLHVEVPQVKFREISGDKTGETSAEIRARVIAARKIQQKRFAHKPKITCNACIGPKELKKFCALDDGTKELLKNAMTELNFSARLRPHFESGADDCGFGRHGKHFERAHFRGGPIPFARPAVVDVKYFARSRAKSSTLRLKTFPHLRRQRTEHDETNLARDEKHQPLERRVREAVAVQPDAEHVHAEP